MSMMTVQRECYFFDIGPFYLLVVTEKDMKGTDPVPHASVYIIIRESRDLYRLPISPVELQKLAYADDNKRTQKSIPRAYNQSFIFATMYIKLFGDSTKTKTSHKSMFGVPFHNISFHLREKLRLVSGESMMAEAAE